MDLPGRERAGFRALSRRRAPHCRPRRIAAGQRAGPRAAGLCWALLTLLAATGTYYALLFTLAQYLQQGLGDSPLVSGLALVPWVAAFGLAGSSCAGCRRAWRPSRQAP